MSGVTLTLLLTQQCVGVRDECVRNGVRKGLPSRKTALHADNAGISKFHERIRRASTTRSSGTVNHNRCRFVGDKPLHIFTQAVCWQVRGARDVPAVQLMLAS